MFTRCVAERGVVRWQNNFALKPTGTLHALDDAARLTDSALPEIG